MLASGSVLAARAAGLSFAARRAESPFIFVHVRSIAGHCLAGLAARHQARSELRQLRLLNRGVGAHLGCGLHLGKSTYME